MAFEIQFNDPDVTLYGGHCFYVDGTLRTETENIFVYGINGSGKSLLLSLISHLFGYPARDVKSIDSSKINVICSKVIKKVVTVRQTASHNFASNLISDEFKLVYADSEFHANDFRAELSNFLITNLDIKPALLSRNYRTLSSGEKQIIAIGLALLSNADLILLDEPIARLSNKYAIRLIELLNTRNKNRYAIMTSHLSDIALASSLLTDTNGYLVEKSNNSLIVKPHLSKQRKKISKEEILNLLGNLNIDKESFESEITWSKDFSILPTNIVRCISGNGKNLSEKPFNAEIQLADSTITQVSNLTLRKGLNILYGDNGSGKTLISQMLSGKFKSNRNPLTWFSKKSRLWVSGENPIIDLSSLNVGLPDYTNLGWLNKHVQSFYLPSETESFLLDDEKVAQELSYTCESDRIPQILLWLAQFDIKEGDIVKNLSFGQRKLVAFSEMPYSLVLPILDEPLANIAYQHQMILCKAIQDNINSGRWYSVVITSNRPYETLELFYKSYVGMYD